MQFESIRDPSHRVTLSTALSRGLAPDGGLYVPERLPAADIEALQDAVTLPELALRMLAPFAAGDVLETLLGQAASDAFSFPAPLTEVESESGHLSVLELFHGPTAAFKDFGARFLAAALERLPRDANRRFTVLVATSGDTGGAVAAAFYGRPWAQVVVLYPRGLVSARQQQQLACWGGNVETLSVAGTFDDCQDLVKGAFADPVLTESLRLSSANSINVGRLLPQMVYYAQASLVLAARDGAPASFIIPTGNLGNALACIWRGRWDCRLATSSWRRTQIVPSSTISPAENGNPGRAWLRLRRRWMWAIPATSSACAGSTPTARRSVAGSMPGRSEMRRSATQSAATGRSSGAPGARIPPRPPASTGAYRRPVAMGAG
jgi:threonine synthase